MPNKRAMRSGFCCMNARSSSPLLIGNQVSPRSSDMWAPLMYVVTATDPWVAKFGDTPMLMGRVDGRVSRSAQVRPPFVEWKNPSKPPRNRVRLSTDAAPFAARMRPKCGRFSYRAWYFCVLRVRPTLVCVQHSAPSRDVNTPAVHVDTHRVESDANAGENAIDEIDVSASPTFFTA